MKVRILLMVTLTLTLVMASSLTVIPALADDAVVPFKATYVTHPTIVDFTGGIMTIVIPAEGKATHLGESTWYADMRVDTNGWPWTQGGQMTFTAANGDQLFGTFAGFAVPTPAGVEFWGEFEITHGTVRFEGATARGGYRGVAGVGEGILYFGGTLFK